MGNSLFAPIIFVLLFWWLSTGAILGLSRINKRWFNLAACVSLVVGVVGTVGIALLREDQTQFGAYLGFSFGVLIWGAHEALFLLGFVNGPRRDPCPPGLRIFKRFIASTETVIHHEVFLATHALVLFLLSAGADNKVGALTFALLWAMRLTAKLVIFFGAPNVSRELLPDHLKYLGTYFTQKANLVPASLAIVFALAVTISFGGLAFASEAESMSWVGYSLLTTLAALAFLEHVALVAPVPDPTLWGWAMGNENPVNAIVSNVRSTPSPSVQQRKSNLEPLPGEL
ncbi:MAG: putative photosynthetic complex assembly protein PuhE [Pseudomonadota bacterium]